MSNHNIGSPTSGTDEECCFHGVVIYILSSPDLETKDERKGVKVCSEFSHPHHRDRRHHQRTGGRRGLWLAGRWGRSGSSGPSPVRRRLPPAPEPSPQPPPCRAARCCAGEGVGAAAAGGATLGVGGGGVHEGRGWCCFCRDRRRVESLKIRHSLGVRFEHERWYKADDGCAKCSWSGWNP